MIRMSSQFPKSYRTKGVRFSFDDAELAEITDIVEFGVVVGIAWLISESVLDSLLKVDVIATYSVLGKWVAFFITLLIYYKLLRIHIRVDKEL